MKFMSACVTLILLYSCSADHYETRARIIERRLLPDSQLLIKYSFVAGTQVVTDSVRTRNRIIPHDSILVRYSPDNPKKNTLRFQ